MDLGFTAGQWALAAIGAFLIGLDKTGFPGLIYVTIAIFAHLLDARQSVGFILPILICGDIIAVAVYKRHARWDHIAHVAPFIAGGIIAGFFLFKIIPAPLFKPLLGAIILLLTAVHFLRLRLIAADAGPVPKKPGMVFAGITGFAGGIATMLANAAGSITALYFLAARQKKYEFIGTMAWLFFIVNLFKVPFQVSLGVLTFSSATASAILAIFCIAGGIAGPILTKFVSQKWFERIVWAMVLAGAVRLLVP